MSDHENQEAGSTEDQSMNLVAAGWHIEQFTAAVFLRTGTRTQSEPVPCPLIFDAGSAGRLMTLPVLPVQSPDAAPALSGYDH
jgi:hypothetical protein